MLEPLESRVQKLESAMESVNKSIEGFQYTLHGINGEGGLIRRFDKFVISWFAREEEKKTYDDRMEKQQKSLVELVKEKRSSRTFLITIVAVVCTVIGTVIAVLTYENVTRHSLLIDPTQSETYAAQQATQDAGVRKGD